MMKIEDYISKGCDNAISRDDLCKLTHKLDRDNRALIAIAVRERHIPIVNVGYGYFIYDGSDKDEAELSEYYRKEVSRGKKIFERTEILKKILNKDKNQEEIVW